ncbi:carbohydrate ABC transporter permease [Paenibacillus sp. NPDC058071]|uniref:carbohydrate ABC transporter permease n=1 Tax=Paenibacillus sp. NPDC058071 TaxID=3346326 RepID=UPI0036D8F73D
MGRKITDRKFGFWSTVPAIVAVFGIVLYPLIQTFIYSLKNMSLTSSSAGAFVGLRNYASALGDAEIWSAIGKTAYFTVFSIGIEIILGVLIALLLNEKFVGAGLLRSVIILPWAIPTIVNGVLWKWIYHPEFGALNGLLSGLGLIDTYQSWLGSPVRALNMVILADVWKMTPFVAIFVLAALQMTNKGIYEAASIDGAGLFRRFFTLTLPHLKGTLLILIVIRTMEAFKVFDLIFALTQGGPMNGTMVINYLTYVKSFVHLDFSAGATLSFLIAGLIGLLTVLYVRALGREESAREKA